MIILLDRVYNWLFNDKWYITILFVTGYQEIIKEGTATPDVYP